MKSFITVLRHKMMVLFIQIIQKICNRSQQNQSRTGRLQARNVKAMCNRSFTLE
jgi:hypothetical protein